MKKFVAAMLVINSFLSVALAAHDLEPKYQVVKGSKVVFHACDMNVGDRIRDSFSDDPEKVFSRGKCKVVSDINAEEVAFYFPIDLETWLQNTDSIQVVRDGKIVRCDVDEQACADQYYQGENWPVRSNFLFSPDQKQLILNKMIQNNGKNTHIYFFSHESKKEDHNQGRFGFIRSYNLKEARLLLK